MMPTLYMDEHVHGALVVELRSRGVDVVTAHEDGCVGSDDPVLLDRANALGRLLVTYDADFLREAARRSAAGKSFTGIIYANPNTITIGELLKDLETICKAATAEELANAVVRLPL
jgi:predicted nuclease of predicted toxin-antitoxin system